MSDEGLALAGFEIWDNVSKLTADQLKLADDLYDQQYRADGVEVPCTFDERPEHVKAAIRQEFWRMVFRGSWDNQRAFDHPLSICEKPFPFWANRLYIGHLLQDSSSPPLLLTTCEGGGNAPPILRRGEYSEQDWKDQLQEAIDKSSRLPTGSPPRQDPARPSNAVDAYTQISIVPPWRRRGKPVFLTCKCRWKSEDSGEVTREIIDVASDLVPLEHVNLDQYGTLDDATVDALDVLRSTTAMWVRKHNLSVVAFWACRRLVRNLKQLAEESFTVTAFFPRYESKERNIEDDFDQDDFEQLLRNDLRRALVPFRSAVPQDPGRRSLIKYHFPDHIVQRCLGKEFEYFVASLDSLRSLWSTDQDEEEDVVAEPVREGTQRAKLPPPEMPPPLKRRWSWLSHSSDESLRGVTRPNKEELLRFSRGLRFETRH